MGLLAPWCTIALVFLASLAGVPLTIHIQGNDKKPVEAEILIQSFPDRGKSIIVMKTMNGELALPAAIMRQYANKSVYILVAPIDEGKYIFKGQVASVDDLFKGPLTVAVKRRVR